MKKNSFYRGMLFMILLGAILAGCGGGGGGSKGPSNGVLSSATYGGADAKGDHIAITIDGKASTLTITNYTLKKSAGPFSFSRVTDPARNEGYQNLYRTQNLSDSENRYAQFVIADGAAILFQIFEDDRPYGTPWFAFCRKDTSNLLNESKKTAYNWVNFKMDITPDDGIENNCEAGFLAIDDDAEGTWYGAGYNHQADVSGGTGYVNGVHDICGGRIKTSDFYYVPSIVAYTAGGDSTLISTRNNDFIMDLGENNGAYYMIRQANTKDWQSVYNGTYFMLVYESKAQSITSMKLVLNGKNYQISQDGELLLSGPLSNVDQKGLGGKILTNLFKDYSNLSAAESNIIKEAYNCYGSFIGGDFESSVLYMIIDPNGRYCCVTIAKRSGSEYDYWFGFGVKG